MKIFVALIVVDDKVVNVDNATEAATWLAMAGAQDVTVWETLSYIDVSALERRLDRSIEHLIKRE